MLDVIIRNARIVDGTGAPWYRGDVGLAGDTIAAVGDLAGADAREVLSADGAALAPGFIDIHTHSDWPLLVDGDGHSHIRQGVTTTVVGNCGNSAAPLVGPALSGARRRLAVDHPTLELPEEPLGMGAYLAWLEDGGMSPNVLALVGHGTLRSAVMGFDAGSPTDGQLDEMRTLLRSCMAEGAWGLSTGLIYAPGSYARTGELVALAREAGRAGGIYASHIRGENDTLFLAIEEALAIGKAAEIPVQVAHLKAMGRHMWGSSLRLLEMLEEARARGIDVTGDQYPYEASATGLAAYLPGWAHEGGVDALLRRLEDPATRDQMRRDIEEGVDGWVSLYRGVGWENTLVTRCAYPALEGRTVAEIAEARGKDPFDTAFDLLLDNRGNVGGVYFTIGTEDLERIMVHPVTMIGSDSGVGAADGPLARGKPHPRGFGTFVRVLGTYVRDRGILTLEEAVRKMTALPAARLGLGDRGLLRPGMRADLVLFDPETVADRATYIAPLQYPVGIRSVFVNGRETVRDDRHLGVRAGRVLRRRAAGV